MASCESMQAFLLEHRASILVIEKGFRKRFMISQVLGSSFMTSEVLG